MSNEPDRGKRIALTIAAIGITLEVVTIFLLASERISSAVGMPLVMTGMFLAFVPVFVLARRQRRR